jgi:hypothetical protein
MYSAGTIPLLDASHWLRSPSAYEAVLMRGLHVLIYLIFSVKALSAKPASHHQTHKCHVRRKRHWAAPTTEKK